MKFAFFFLFILLFSGCCALSEDAEEPRVQVSEDLSGDIFEPTYDEPDDEPDTDTGEQKSSLESEEIIYYSIGWDIHATLYPSEKDAPTTAILLMPMLGEDRSSYPESFIKRLHNEIPEAIVLNIDSRGHGESTNIGTWEQMDYYQFRDMQNDILDSKNYFEDNHPTVYKYYVVGASIGSTAAINAGARDRNIYKVAMISPGIEYKGVNIERSVDDYEFSLLVAASSGDTYSTDAIDEIQSISSSHITKKIYSGSAHGTDLFDATKYETESLETVILGFLKK